MLKLIVEQTGDGYTVTQGDKYADHLAYDEMIGVVSAVMMPENRPCVGWLRTKDQYEADEKLKTKRIEEFNSNNNI